MKVSSTNKYQTEGNCKYKEMTFDGIASMGLWTKLIFLPSELS